jgi:hypothetical protein
MEQIFDSSQMLNQSNLMSSAKKQGLNTHIRTLNASNIYSK